MKYPQRTNESRMLITIYGRLCKSGQHIALNQGFAKNQDQVRKLVLDTRNSINLKTRQDYSAFVPKRVNKINSLVATEEVLNEATILEIPKEDRPIHYTKDIRRMYKRGASLWRIAKVFGTSKAKVKQILQS